MPLARKFRFTVLNLTGQPIAVGGIVIKSRNQKWASGSKSFEAEATVYSNGGTITSGSYDSGALQDNSLTLDEVGHFIWTVTAPASANGDVWLYYEPITDDGTVYPSNGYGIPISSMNFTAAGTRSLPFCIV